MPMSLNVSERPVEHQGRTGEWGYENYAPHITAETACDIDPNEPTNVRRSHRCFICRRFPVATVWSDDTKPRHCRLPGYADVDHTL